MNNVSVVLIRQTLRVISPATYARRILKPSGHVCS